MGRIACAKARESDPSVLVVRTTEYRPVPADGRGDRCRVAHGLDGRTRDGRTRATDSTHWRTAALGMATIRRRKGGGDGAEGVDAAGSGVGADVAEAAGGAAAGGGRVRRQRTVAENLERWGHVFSVVGQMFSAVWQLLVAVVLWVCPLCAREEKRHLK